MTRIEEMDYLLESRKLFKLVCGAGNEDTEEVRRLAFVYCIAGAKLFDVSANADVVNAALEGIEHACTYAKKFNREIKTHPFVNVSIGMKGDPHVRKAIVNDQCVQCGCCVPECPTEAISSEYIVDTKRCIGCGHCNAACDYSAVDYTHPQKNLETILQQCKSAGAEQVELHAAVADSGSIMSEWEMATDIFNDNYVSMCLDRLHIGDSQLRRRIREARQITKDRFIVQADGVPMSGGKDDYNTTLQAVAIADIVMKSKINVKVLLSGGTNSLTTQLAQMCGVNWHGVAIGTFARNLVKQQIQKSNFVDDRDAVNQAVEIADKLVHDNIGEPVW